MILSVIGFEDKETISLHLPSDRDGIACLPNSY